MITVDEVLNDFDVCSQFTIQRSIGHFAIGGWAVDSTQNIACVGAVRNASGKELAQLPESDRVSEILTFRSVTRMYATTANNADGNAQTSDLLVYQGDTYRVISVKNYSEQGYYWAMAARTAGN